VWDKTLAALDMNLATIVQQADRSSGELLKSAENGQQLVQQLSKEIRTVSYLLHPPLLDEVGLAGALRMYVEGLSTRSGCDVSLSIPEDFGRLPSEMELVMFRIVQECLTNVYRHSGSRSAGIHLVRTSENVSLAVEDVGKGMSAEKLNAIRTQGGGGGVGFRPEHRLRFGTKSLGSSSTHI